MIEIHTLKGGWKDVSSLEGTALKNIFLSNKGTLIVDACTSLVEGKF